MRIFSQKHFTLLKEQKISLANTIFLRRKKQHKERKSKLEITTILFQFLKIFAHFFRQNKEGINQLEERN